LPRFQRASFTTRFPFATVTLSDDALPMSARITGWSPLVPGDADSSSLPVAALEHEFTNPTSGEIEAVFSFNTKNFLPLEDGDRRAVHAGGNGFTLWATGKAEEPWKEAWFSVSTPEAGALVNHAWFRGGWWDTLTMAWKDVESASVLARPLITDGAPSPGATLFVPIALAPGAKRTVVARLA
jgi:hypothetical protein